MRRWVLASIFLPVTVAQAAASALMYTFSMRALGQPMLGNGIAMRARELDRLAQADPENRMLVGLGDHLHRLFTLSGEAGFLALFAAIALACSALFTFFVFVWLYRHCGQALQ